MATEEFFESNGVHLPAHLRTKTKRWLSLIIVVVVNAFASGPVASWATLEPILIKEGVWAGPDQLGKLTSVYTIAVGAGLLSYMVIGFIYDAVGPQLIGAISAFLVALCLIVMAIAMQYPLLNNLLWIAYPLTVVFGYANTMAGYAWLFILHEDSNTVAALVGCVQVLSDSLVLIAVWLHDEFGFSVGIYLLINAVVSVLAGFVCIALIPSYTLFRQIASAVERSAVQSTKLDLENSDYGAIDSNDDSKAGSHQAESIWEVCQQSVRNMADFFLCVFGLHPGAFIMMALMAVTQYMFAYYPQIVMFPFYDDLLGLKDATRLVNIWGGMYATFGAATLLCVGRVVDYIGFFASLALLIPIIIATVALLCMPTLMGQVLAQFLIALISNPVVYVLLPCWIFSYMPVELFGSAFGIFAGIIGVCDLTLVPLGTSLSRLIDTVIFHVYPLPAFVLLSTMIMWGALAVVTILLYILFSRIYPMPPPGSTTMKDVRRAWNDPSTIAQPIKRYRPSAKKKPVQTPTCPTLEDLCKRSSASCVSICENPHRS